MAVLTLTAASMPEVDAAGVVGGAALPKVKSFDGVKSGSNSNGSNSAAYTFAGGSSGADTIDNVNLLKGVTAAGTRSTKSSRLYKFLSSSYQTQADLDAAVASLGILTSGNAASALRFITAAPGVPTATVTTAAATGSSRIALGASISA